MNPLHWVLASLTKAIRLEENYLIPIDILKELSDQFELSYSILKTFLDLFDDLSYFLIN